jgi:hypothetical protein
LGGEFFCHFVTKKLGMTHTNDFCEKKKKKWQSDHCPSVEVLKPRSQLSVCRGPETQCPFIEVLKLRSWEPGTGGLYVCVRPSVCLTGQFCHRKCRGRFCIFYGRIVVGRTPAHTHTRNNTRNKWLYIWDSSLRDFGP